MEFDMAPITSSIIMVVGVGGGGGNAVNHMYRQGIADVSFMVCNTDAQVLAKSPVPNKIQMGEGLGAGNDPEKGRKAAENSIEDIKEIFRVNNTRMVFVTAGMGGGTGTGAAPVIAQAAHEMGILTVAIVTIPFESEGRPRIEQAIEGISQISSCVDSLIVINNAHIVEIYGDLPVSKAFAKADDILTAAAKSISDIITKPHLVNVDFADVKKVMSNSGVAIMGSSIASGEGRAIAALSEAMSSPLLHHKNIIGAKQVLVSITTCEGDGEIKMSETGQIADYIQECSATGNNTNLIWGIGYDETLDADQIRATVVATGFDVSNIPAIKEYYRHTLGNKLNRTAEGQTQQNNGKQVIDLEGEIANTKPKQKESDANDMGDFTVIDKPVEEPTQQRENHYRPQSQPIHITPRYSAPATITPQPAAPPVSEITQEPNTKPTPPLENNDTRPKSIYELTPEEIEDIPAWKRREMELESEVPQGVKIQRETLAPEETQQRQYQTIDLFD